MHTTLQTDQVHVFSPRVGNWRVRLRDLSRKLQNDATVDVQKRLRQVARETVESTDKDEGAVRPNTLRLAYACSVAEDILRAGGRLFEKDSQLYLAWPNWEGPDGRSLAYKALNALAKKTAPSPEEREELSDCFATELDRGALIEVLEEGQFGLVSASDRHPSGVGYDRLFNFALRHWSMPYRGREGRMRRFLVIGRHDNLGESPVVVGIIEVGDDAPYNTPRDKFLGLHKDAFKEWFKRHRDKRTLAKTIREHFSRLRSAISGKTGLAGREAKAILEDEKAISKHAKGRSRSGTDLYKKKRIAYHLRLAHGEYAAQLLANGRSFGEVEGSLSKGIRAVHNISLPRLHMEATVCGAVPPFAIALGGKLVTSFLGHPKVRRTAKEDPGEILSRIFETEQLRELLPIHGLLGMTTRGLYPQHSAQYNRASVAGKDGELRLEKIGVTKGETTTLISSRTAKLARKLLAHTQAAGSVAETYGSGGAKRQRVLERASREAGLEEDIVYAGIRRPIYGVRLAANIEEVVWEGLSPRWSVFPGGDGEYSEEAASQWRQRWLETGIRRIEESEDEPRDLFDALREES